jgi:micrococcal nuclease
MKIRISPSAARPAGWITLVLFVLAVAGCAAESASTRPWETVWSDYPELRGKTAEETVVRRVVDGDTFVTREGGRVRLIGVNAPEISGGAEYYGEEAAAYTRRMLTGQTVWMFRDVSETDRYGRLLRFVFVPGDALMFNERLVREGYASAATYPPDVSLADRFREAEREARSEGAGLWGGGDDAAAATGKRSRPVDPPEADGGAASGAGDAGLAASCPSPDIKGNINSRGERIYHVPGSRYYDRTVAEVWFCTEDEAEAAGFRAPKSGG